MNLSRLKLYNFYFSLSIIWFVVRRKSIIVVDQNLSLGNT